jgi:biotin carboxylase
VDRDDNIRSPGLSNAKGRPTIGVLYDPRSTFALTLRGWVGDYCDLVWIVDEGLAPLGSADRTLLARLGPVVDITGADPASAIRTVAEAELTGIVTFADRRIRVASMLTDALGLPGISPECADRLVSKSRQRAAFAAAGIAVPRVWSVASGADDATVEAIVGEAMPPLVVKPDEGDGSRNIFHVEDVESLRAVLIDARATGRPVVVEEFLRGASPPRPELGDYVSVESVVSRGRVQHVAINGRFPVAWPFRETGFFIPAVISEGDTRAVLDLASTAVCSLGFDVGCTHTEIKLTPDGPRVIEVNGRLGGGVPEMVHLVTGTNLFEVACRLAADEDVRFDALLPCNEVAYLFYVQAPAGVQRVASIDGLELLQSSPGVEEVRLNHPPGSVVDWHAGNHDYVFSVLGVASGHDALIEASRNLEDKVVISYA